MSFTTCPLTVTCLTWKTAFGDSAGSFVETMWPVVFRFWLIPTASKVRPFVQANENVAISPFAGSAPAVRREQAQRQTGDRRPAIAVALRITPPQSEVPAKPRVQPRSHRRQFESSGSGDRFAWARARPGAASGMRTSATSDLRAARHPARRARRRHARLCDERQVTNPGSGPAAVARARGKASQTRPTVPRAR